VTPLLTSLAEIEERARCTKLCVVREGNCDNCNDFFSRDVPALVSAVRVLSETVENMWALLICDFTSKRPTGLYWNSVDGEDVRCDCDGCDALRLAEQGLAKAQECLR
jgi:hypothetical protein